MFHLMQVIFLCFFLIFPAGALALTVAIDAGHGGFETGIVQPPNNSNESFIPEKELNLQIAVETVKALAEKGIKSYLTRDSDRFMRISERAYAAQAKKPSLFISIHTSAGRGFNIYTSIAGGDDPAGYYGPMGRQRPFIAESERLARELEEAIKELFPGEAFFYRQMPLPLLDQIAAPAIMIEAPNPLYFNYSGGDGTKLVAAAIAAGVVSYGEGENGNAETQ